MRFMYYFWNNWKKQGYVHGQTIKPFYERMVIEGNKKELNEFLRQEEKILLEKQIETTELKLVSLNLYRTNLLTTRKKFIDSKDAEIKIVSDKYFEEKMMQNVSYDKLKELDAEKIHYVNSKINKLKDDLSSYQDKMSDWVRNKMDKLSTTLLGLYNFDKNKLSDTVIKDFKNMIEHKDSNDNNERSNLSTKQKLYLFVLAIIVFYDVYFGSILVRDFFQDKGISSFFVDNFLIYLLAIFFVFLMVVFFHFIVKFLSEKKDENKYMKQFGVLSLIVLFVVLFAYIYNSTGSQGIQSIKDISLNVEFLLRLLIFPALLVGEYLIKEIDISSIKFNKVDYFYKDIKKYIKLLFSKLYFFYEQKSFFNATRDNLLIVRDNIEKFETSLETTFSFKSVLDDTTDIQSILTPIYESNQLLINEFKLKREEIIHKFEEDKKMIENKYILDIEKIDKKIDILDRQINHITQNLGDAENNIGEGIRLGLLSK